MAYQQQERDENALIEKLVAVNRVSKTVKGGRRMGFAAFIVMGDGKGKVGFGHGKAKEVPEAMKKATDDAKKNLQRVPLREGRTIHHDVNGRFGAGKVMLRAAPSGTGIIAGGPMRAVFEALGIHDVVAKSTGSSNPYNMVKATMDALLKTRAPKAIAAKRGKKINEIVARRELAEGRQVKADKAATEE
jgi:small subunit ribosomal protein S5